MGTSRGHVVGAVRSAVLLGFFVLAAPGAAVAAPGDVATIQRVAGQGFSGYGGDGGLATLAGVPQPKGLALDASGNLYISALGGLRRVDASTGVIMTVADAAEAVLSPYPGPGARSMCIDGEGNLYFAGLNFDRSPIDGLGYSTGTFRGEVLKYDVTTGAVSIIASFPGASGGMGIAFGPDGDLYVSSQSKSQVYRVDVPSGIVSVVAGTGTSGFGGDGALAVDATLNGPLGLAFDAGGDLYIADEMNNRIRRVAMSSGIITTYLGDGGNGDGGDGGPYSSASVLRPCSVLFNAVGDAFIRSRSSIRRIDGATGTIDHLVTVTGGQGASNPPAMMLDELGRLLFCVPSWDDTQGRIDRVDPATLVRTRVAGVDAWTGDGGPALLAAVSPSDVVEDSAGNLFVSDFSTKSIRRIDAITGTITTVTSGGLSPQFVPFGIDLDGNGQLIVAGAIHVWRIDPATGERAVIAGSGGAAGGIGGPATDAGLNSVNDVVVGANGDIYIACSSQGVRRIDGGTGIITQYAGNGIYNGTSSGDGGPATDAYLYASDLALDAGGNLYVVDGATRHIRRIDSATQVITTVAGTGASTFFEGRLATETGCYPVGIAIDGDGNIFFGERGTPRIRRIDSASGVAVTVAGSGTWAPRTASGDGGAALGATFVTPCTALRVDSQGRLLVCGTTLRRIDNPSEPGAVIQAPASVVRESNTGNNSANLTFTIAVVGLAPSGSSLVVEDQTGARNLLTTAATSGNYNVSAVFPIGPSTVLARLVDSQGVTSSQASIAVQVQDTLAPAIIGCANKTVVSPTLDPIGVTPAILSVSATDLCDPTPSLVVSPSVLPLGLSTVTATATDATGNVSSCAFQVDVVYAATTSVETTLPSGYSRTVELTFGDLTGPGAATVTTTDFGPDLPSGYQFTGDSVWYEIATGASFTGSVELSFSWNEGEFDPESTIAILHYENGAWVDITTSVDTVNNRVYAVTSSFSPFVMARTNYTFTGFNHPIASDGSSVFGLGTVLPVAFQIFRPNGSLATNATAHLALYRVLDADLGQYEPVAAVSASHPDDGDLFQFDEAEGRYTFDLTTSTLAEGGYLAVVALDDGASYQIAFSLSGEIDGTAPTISSTPDVHANATSTLGAVVTFTLPTAMDDVDGPVAVTCSRVSGSLFDVGVTTVVCTATDAHHNIATSRFDVIVQIDPRYLKGAVADQLNALIPTSDKATVKRLLKAIKDIQDSLAADLWVDGLHLSAKGRKVFREESQAVEQLLQIASPVATIGQAVASLVEADHVLAATALAEATAANPTSAHVATANAEIELAATANGAGNFRDAIKHYRKAWRSSLSALGL